MKPGHLGSSIEFEGSDQEPNMRGEEALNFYREETEPPGSVLSFLDPAIDLFANSAAPAFEAFGRPIAVQTKSPMEATSSRSMPVSNPSPCNR